MSTETVVVEVAFTAPEGTKDDMENIEGIETVLDYLREAHEEGRIEWTNLTATPRG